MDFDYSQLVRGRLSMLLAGILTVASSSVAAQTNETYEYDALGRLIMVTRAPGLTTTYVYDAAGNRTQRTTATAGVTPQPFHLGGPTSVASGAWAASNTITVSGISAVVPVTISNGQYRINGGAWTAGAGTASANQTIQVRAQAPAVGGTSAVASLTIGGVTGTFQVTAIVDTSPDSFDLGPAKTVSPGAWAESAAATISGVNAPTPVTISGGQYRINGGAWQTAAGSIHAGQTIQARLQAHSSAGVSTGANLVVGGLTRSFFVTSSTPAPTPGPFDLGGPVYVEPGEWAWSNIVTISLASPAAISITGGQYRINGGTWQTGAGTLSPGQTVQIRVVAALLDGVSRSGTLTVGGVSDTFVVHAYVDNSGPCIPPPGKDYCNEV